MNRKVKEKVYLADVVGMINASEELVKARGKKFTVQGIGKVIKSEKGSAFRPAGKEGKKSYYRETIFQALYDLLVKQYGIEKAYLEDFDESTGADEKAIEEADFVPSRDIQKLQSGSEMKDRTSRVIGKMTNGCLSLPSELHRSEDYKKKAGHVALSQVIEATRHENSDEGKLAKAAEVENVKPQDAKGSYYELPPDFFMTLEEMVKNAVQEQICEARPDLCDEGVIIKDKAKVLQKYAIELNKSMYWRGAIVGALAATGIILLGIGFANNFIQSLF